MARITASIVTYNSEDEICTALDSIVESGIDDSNIYVIDNDSKDETCSIVENKYPNVKLIKSNINVGFGAGHNLAIKEVDSDYHIIINPDVQIKKGQIEEMVKYMEDNKNVCILTPKVYNEDGTEQFLPKKYPSIKYLLSGILEKKFKHFYKLRSEYTFRGEIIEKPVHIDFCTGCFMFCRTEPLKKVGGFDEKYFLHFEDADLTREMQYYGETMYVPYVSIVHKWHRENHSNSKIKRIALKSMLIYFKKWRRRHEKK